MVSFSNGAYVAIIGARGFFGRAGNSEGDGGARVEMKIVLPPAAEKKPREMQKCCRFI